MRRLAALAVVAACHPHAPLPAPLPEGVTIAVYERFSVVDDRRDVTVDGDTLALEHVDPGAALASLSIESDLTVGACRREVANKAAGTVHCEVVSPRAPGRHRVRLVYVSTALRYRAEHDVTVAADRAHAVTRFAVETPAWGERAELVLFDGAPGGDHPPREVARGVATLDGTTAILATAERDVPATLRRVYDGAVLGDLPASDAAWGRESQPSVWVWLELDGLSLAPGPVRVHAGEREVIVPAEGRRTGHHLVRLPLWVDADLRGLRARFVDLGEGAGLAERFLLGIASNASDPREVWIEEHVRPARRRRIERAWPARPVLAGDVLRTKLVVKPGTIERTGFTIAYDY
jgi:hypothetical protein